MANPEVQLPPQIDLSPYRDGMDEAQLARFDRMISITVDSAPALVAAMARHGDDEQIKGFLQLQEDYLRHRDALELVGSGGIYMETTADLSGESGTFIGSARLIYFESFTDDSGHEQIFSPRGTKSWNVGVIWPDLAKAINIHESLSPNMSNFFSKKYESSAFAGVVDERNEREQYRRRYSGPDKSVLLKHATAFARLHDGGELTPGESLVVTMVANLGYDVDRVGEIMTEHIKHRQTNEESQIRFRDNLNAL